MSRYHEEGPDCLNPFCPASSPCRISLKRRIEIWGFHPQPRSGTSATNWMPWRNAGGQSLEQSVSPSKFDGQPTSRQASQTNEEQLPILDHHHRGTPPLPHRAQRDCHREAIQNGSLWWKRAQGRNHHRPAPRLADVPTGPALRFKTGGLRSRTAEQAPAPGAGSLPRVRIPI